MLPTLALKSATHWALQRAAHLGRTDSLSTFFSIARSASVGCTSTILPLTACLQAAAPLLQS